MSSFLARDRGPDLVVVPAVLDDDELMSELSCEVKERVVEDEISLSPASLRCLEMPYRLASLLPDMLVDDMQRVVVLTSKAVAPDHIDPAAATKLIEPYPI